MSCKIIAAHICISYGTRPYSCADQETVLSEYDNVLFVVVFCFLVDEGGRTQIPL